MIVDTFSLITDIKQTSKHFTYNLSAYLSHFSAFSVKFYAQNKMKCDCSCESCWIFFLHDQKKERLIRCLIVPRLIRVLISFLPGLFFSTHAHIIIQSERRAGNRHSEYNSVCYSWIFGFGWKGIQTVFGLIWMSFLSWGDRVCVQARYNEQDPLSPLTHRMSLHCHSDT